VIRTHPSGTVLLLVVYTTLFFSFSSVFTSSDVSLNLSHEHVPFVLLNDEVSVY